MSFRCGFLGSKLMLGLFVGLSTAGVPALFSAGSAAAPSRDTLVLRITRFGGVVWGSVSVRYQSDGVLKPLGLCTHRRCNYRPPHGVTLILTEKAKDSRVWRFRSWIVHNGGRLNHVSASTLTLRIRSHLYNNIHDYRAHVKANYYYP